MPAVPTSLWPPNMPLPLHLHCLHQQMVFHHHRLQLARSDPSGPTCRDRDHERELDAVSTAACSTADSESSSLQHAIDEALIDALLAALTLNPSRDASSTDLKVDGVPQRPPVPRNSILLSEMLPEPVRTSTSEPRIARFPEPLPAPILSTTPCLPPTLEETKEARHISGLSADNCNLNSKPESLDASSEPNPPEEASQELKNGSMEVLSAGDDTQVPSPSRASTMSTDVPTLSIPSEGSVFHSDGRCKPCAFFYKDGCKSASNCKFCHLCDEGEKKRRARERKRPSTEPWGLIHRGPMFAF